MPAITVTDETLALSTEARRLLFQIGMVGAGNGMKFEAFAMFGKLGLAEPTEAFPLVGLAYCQILSGQFKGAFQVLDLPVVRDSELAPFADGLKVLGLHLSGGPTECIPEETSGFPESVQEMIHATTAKTV